MYPVSGFDLVIINLIEENWKKICFEISSPYFSLGYIFTSKLFNFSKTFTYFFDHFQNVWTSSNRRRNWNLRIPGRDRSAHELDHQHLLLQQGNLLARVDLQRLGRPGQDPLWVFDRPNQTGQWQGALHQGHPGQEQQHPDHHRYRYVKYKLKRETMLSKQWLRFIVNYENEGSPQNRRHQNRQRKVIVNLK